MPRKRSRKGAGRRRNTVSRPFDRPNQILARKLHYRGALNSTAGGVLVGQFSTDPTAWYETSDMALEFDEYRVMGVELRYFPWYPNGVATPGGQLNGELVFVFDNDDLSALASYNEALGHGAYIRRTDALTANGKRFASFRWRRPTSGKDTAITWYNLQSPTAYGGIKWYADGLTVSTAYGIAEVILDVQFRGSVNV